MRVVYVVLVVKDGLVNTGTRVTLTASHHSVSSSTCCLHGFASSLGHCSLMNISHYLSECCWGWGLPRKCFLREEAELEVSWNAYLWWGYLLIIFLNIF
jgi:hypothetical protein